MSLKENVKDYDDLKKLIEAKKDIVELYKKEYEEKMVDIVSTIKELEGRLQGKFTLIETEIKDEFKKDKTVKKFYGGFAIQEVKTVDYDEAKALAFAKEKDMFLMLDKKSFEKAIDGLTLDFIKKDTTTRVTTPKEIKLED